MIRRKWTEEDRLDLAAKRSEGKKVKQIARELNRTEKSITNYLDRHGNEIRDLVSFIHEVKYPSVEIVDNRTLGQKILGWLRKNG
tara:strand:+ start:1960 stop:2214 length:255 start_codon:yes stop_codon:yes gene_type:complete